MNLGMFVLAKFTAVAKEMTVETFLSTILTARNKICIFLC